MLTPATDYQTLCDTFRWEVPEYYNIGVDICDKWAHQPDRLALIYEDETGRTRRYTFLDLKRRSNRLANGLLGDLFDEVLNDRKRDIGFEQRDPHFTHRAANIFFPKRAAPA